MSKKKERSKTHDKGGGIDRRKFIMAAGATAAISTLGGLNAKGAPAAGAQTVSVSARPGVLDNSPIVMLWRRVTELKEVKDFVSTNLRMPLIGQDQISAIYDGGVVLVGYAVQDDVATTTASGSTTCSIESPMAVPLQANPASAMIMAPLDFTSSVRIVFAGRGATPLYRSELGETLSFIDDDGNYSSFYRPYTFAFEGKAGEKLAALLKNRERHTIIPASLERDVKRQDIPNPVIGFDLMVSDLAKSRKFYADVLGLTPLSSGPNEAKLDSGSIILSLKSEPSNMLVKFLKRTGRLRADWIVFHVNDIKAKMHALKERGVHFPHGIETSPIGQVAYFNDPDGYSFNLWQPSGKPHGIDFYPALKRILKETTRSAA